MHHRHFFILFALAACGGTVAAPSGPPVDQFGAYVAKAFCAETAKCCDAARLSYGPIGYDNDACLAQMGPHFQQLVAPALATGHATYHPEAIDACAKAIAEREAACADDSILPQSAVTANYSCAAVLEGNIQPGDPCTEDGECSREPGLATSVVSCADAKLSGIPGKTGKVCVRLRYDRKPGESCDTRFNHCDPSLGICVEGGTCAAFLKVGDACPAGGPPCNEPASYCDAASGKCVASGERDQPCDMTTLCNATDVVLTCDPKAHTCQPAYVAGDGQLCAPAAHPSQCGGRQECRQDGVCITVGSNHVFDVSPRSCGYGPLSDGFEYQPKKG